MRARRTHFYGTRDFGRGRPISRKRSSALRITRKILRALDRSILRAVVPLNRGQKARRIYTFGTTLAPRNVHINSIITLRRLRTRNTSGRVANIIKDNTRGAFTIFRDEFRTRARGNQYTARSLFTETTRRAEQIKRTRFIITSRLRVLLARCVRFSISLRDVCLSSFSGRRTGCSRKRRRIDYI